MDGLRAIAVLAVIGFHAFPERITGGFVGVDVFFVISGFLISGIILKGLEQGGFTYADFYARRIRRIFPALAVVLAAVLVAGWRLLFPDEFRNLGKHIFSGAVFVANVAFFREAGYFDSSAELKPLLHLWSLGVEEQFYLVWPLVLWACYRFRLSVLAVVGLIGLASLGLALWITPLKPVAAFFLPPTRFWELLTGSLLAWASIDPKRRFDRLRSLLPAIVREAAGAAASLTGIVLILVAVFALDRDQPFPGWRALLPAGGAALVIAAGPQAALNRWLLATPLMVFVGLISYPLYLWHWPLLSYARIVGTPQLAASTAGAAIAAAFVLATATWQFVEKPIRFGLRRSMKPVAGLCVAVGGLAMAGLAIQFGALHGQLAGPQIDRVEQARTDWDYPGGELNFKRSGGFATLPLKGRAPGSTVFIGDSHLEQYWARVRAVVAAAEPAARSAIFVTHPGCPPLPGANRVDPGYFCDRFFEFAMQQASHEDVRAVVFGAAWEAYFPGPNATWSTVSGRRAALGPGDAETDALFEKLAERIGTLRARGKDVWIVLPNPSAPQFNPASMLPDRIHPEAGAPAQPVVSRAAFAERMRPVRDKLERVAARTGARIVDPMDVLCLAEVCPTATADGVPVYKDSNHLRPFYAREKATFIDPMLRD